MRRRAWLILCLVSAAAAAIALAASVPLTWTGERIFGVHGRTWAAGLQVGNHGHVTVAFITATASGPRGTAVQFDSANTVRAPAGRIVFPYRRIATGPDLTFGGGKDMVAMSISGAISITVGPDGKQSIGGTPDRLVVMAYRAHAPAAVLLPLLSALAWVAWRRWRGPRHDAGRGRCVKCGYDLRATPERCPECGAVPAAATG